MGFIVQHKRNVSAIQDVDGNNIVIINDIRFKGKRSADWKDVREYAMMVLEIIGAVAAVITIFSAGVAVGKFLSCNQKDRP